MESFLEHCTIVLPALTWCWWFIVGIQHSGLLHLGLSTWALLSFGPAVESAYGTLGFGMVYLIGGLFGNLMSFFHTPQGTVGGTVRIFLNFILACTSSAPVAFKDFTS